MAIAAVALASLLMAASAGCGTKAPASSASPGIEQQNLSADAEKFVAEFGSRYSDPVSTYYAETAYASNSPTGWAVMTDNFINNFDPNQDQIPGQSDEFGFVTGELLLNEKVDQQIFIDEFNEVYINAMNQYMNLMAKNPTPEAAKLIKSEFLKYYSDASFEDMPAANTPDKPEVLNLMDTLDGVVAKYGSAANYSVARAVAYDHTGSQEGTIFKDAGPADSGHVEYGERDVEYFFTGGVDIAINVDLFKGDKSTRVTDILKDTELTLWHQPVISGTGENRNTDISIGQRKVAQ